MDIAISSFIEISNNNDGNKNSIIIDLLHIKKKKLTTLYDYSIATDKVISS
jgi:hypothetical protein